MNGATFLRAFFSRAIVARGEVSWDYQNLMPTHASEYHGMRDAKSREARAKAPSGLGNPILSWISMGAPGIRRFFDLAIDSKLHGCGLSALRSYGPWRADR